MMKLVSKFAMDIFPSVLATIIGAYIVNHYINVKPPAGGATAAAVAPAEPKKAARTDSKPAEKSADLGNIPEPGVRAKGISEKAISDKSSAEKASEKAADKEKNTDKADKPSETASIPPTAPVESRRHQPAPREKAAAKNAPAAAPAAEPVATTPAAEPDANDLARAAIERLRGAEHSQEAARTAEPARTVTAPATQPAQPPSIQPLPPPILVSTPSADSRPAADPNRPTPPADIPDPRAPLDLRADAVDAPPAKRPSVADDVLAAAKNMFHSVLPK